MADTKVSALPAYTTPLAADVIPIVDTANTTSKKATFADIENTILDTAYIQMGGFI